MLTLQKLQEEKLLRVGDEMLYHPLRKPENVHFHAGDSDITLFPSETGVKYAQNVGIPQNQRYVIRKIYEDGALDMVPKKLELKVALGGMNGFANVRKVLQKACSVYQNVLLHVTVRSYDLADLWDDTEEVQLVPKPIRVAFYPTRWRKNGCSSQLVSYQNENYYRDYSMDKKYRFYYSDGGGTKWTDKADNLYRTASRRRPVLVTGYPQRFCHLQGNKRNFWLSYHGVLLERGTPTTMEEHLGFVDVHGDFTYEWMGKHVITQAHYVYPIIHVPSDAKVEDVYIGYQSDKRIGKLECNASRVNASH